MRLNESKKRKASKVKDKIHELVMNNNAIFITLTFNNDTLAKTSAITRRRYVARYLKANCDKYVANIDFGAKKAENTITLLLVVISILLIGISTALLK